MLFFRVTGWEVAGKPVFEINSLAREVKGNTVPLPKTLLKLILGIVLPRVLQRKVQALLPVELGQYLSDAPQGFHITGKSCVLETCILVAFLEVPLQCSQNVQCSYIRATLRKKYVQDW